MSAFDYAAETADIGFGWTRRHSNKCSYHEIRGASDRLCKEHGLSVIVPGRDKGKNYIEHQAVQNGTSYKAKLKAIIDG